MSLLDGILNTNLKAEDKDVLTTGASNSVFETGIYEMKIIKNYLNKTTNGSTQLHLSFLCPDTNQIFNDRLTLTTNAGVPYTTKNNKNMPIRGFSLFTSLVALSTGSTLEEINKTIEKDTIGIYNFNTGSMEDQEKDVIKGLIDAPIKMALIKVLANKKTTNNQGQWVFSGERKLKNEFVKYFHPVSNMTYSEILNNEKEASFYTQWKDKFADYTKEEPEHPRDATLPPVMPTGTTGEKVTTESIFGS